MFQSRHSQADGLLKLFPLHKAIIPSSMFSPSFQRHVQSLPKKNFKLNVLSSESGKEGGKRPLAILLPWLAGKDKHLAKYSGLYLNRGFDVLTVNVTIPQLLAPTLGSQVIAKNLFDYIVSDEEHDKIVIHAFSVGCYLWGELLLHYLQSSQDEGKRLVERIVGMVLDSPADVYSLPNGIALASVKNPSVAKAIEVCLKSHLYVMHYIATKHYIKSSQTLHSVPLPCPALFFFSEADKVERPETVRRLANSWASKGIDVSMKCFKNSQHVSHMHMYKEEYVTAFENFLNKLDL